MPRPRPEALLVAHASALFGAISLALVPFGCGAEPAASSGAPPSATPAASIEPTAAAEPGAAATPASVSPPAEPAGTASSALSASATASATAAPSASASARASTSATAPAKPRPRRESGVVEGRPFLVGDVARVAALGSGSDWADEIDLAGASLGPGQREALVHHYTRWALAEHASIASFARFTLQLLALGAPPDLVARATAAMADETRHARLGFGLVTALSGAPVCPAELRIDGALGETTLEAALRLTVREGVVGETLAALEARLAADTTSIPWLKERLVTLAADEARHAELAFAFAAWAVGRAPELARVVQEEVEEWQPPPLEAVSGLDGWGVLDTPARRAVHREGLAIVVRPLARRLSAAASRSAPAPLDLRC